MKVRYIFITPNVRGVANLLFIKLTRKANPLLIKLKKGNYLRNGI